MSPRASWYNDTIHTYQPGMDWKQPRVHNIGLPRYQKDGLHYHEEPNCTTFNKWVSLVMKKWPPETTTTRFCFWPGFFFGTRHYIVFQCFSDPPFFFGYGLKWVHQVRAELWCRGLSPHPAMVLPGRRGAYMLEIPRCWMGLKWCFHASPCQIHEPSTNGSTPNTPPKKM